MTTLAGTTTRATGLPSGRPFTVADLDAIADDGNRYELLDGVLVVTPSPSWRHQNVAINLVMLLREACPDDLIVLTAPFDVRLADDTNVQPDVLVARRSDLTDANLPVAPMLAVEVLSPSTRAIDLHVKRDRLRRAGCPSYWVIDPLSGHLTAWELDPANTTGAYLEVADIDAGDTWEATAPYAVTVDPRALLR